MRHVWISALFLAVLSSCAVQHPAAPRAQSAAETSLLARSTPADGSSVAAPVDTLQLHFVRPTRLLEVTIDGPDGLSPMMVTAAGEIVDYTVPLSGLGPGSYRADWKASAAGVAYSGVIGFTVRG